MLHHLQEDEAISQFYVLAQQFRSLNPQRSVAQFDAWLDTAAQSRLKTVRTFAKFMCDK